MESLFLAQDMFKSLTTCALIFIGCWLLNPSQASPQNNEPSVQRVISLAPHITELLYSAGAEDLIHGVSAYSNYPKAAQHKTIIGDAFHLNLELIQDINPDLILYWQDGTPQQTVMKLQHMQFELFPVEIKHLSDIPEQINRLATRLKTQPVSETQDRKSVV